MRKFLPLCALALLVACGMPDQGYYDANGNYIAPRNATQDNQRFRAPDPGKSQRYYHGRAYEYDERPVTVVPSGMVYTYDRRGYYDYYGNYVTVDAGVPPEMYPPRGMCRVWLPSRPPELQPRVEHCDDIHDRVPAGAYVIYGG